MKPSTRYTLIAVGFVVFLILAPLLVLYVSGRTINLDGKESSATGILDAKSNPTGAKLFIDGKEHSSTPAIARFLKQGEYQFTLSKEGYFDWTKRLPIEAGKVTYAQEGVTEVQLLKKSEPKVLVPQGVSSFVIMNDVLWFVNGNRVVRAPFNNPADQTVIQLNFHPTILTELRNRRHIYLGNNSILDTQTQALVKLTLPNTEYIAQPWDIAVSPNNVILFLGGDGNLYAHDPGAQKNRLIKEKVFAFTMEDNTGYIIDDQARNHYEDSKSNISSAFWDGSNFQDYQIILSGAYGTQLYITDNKELFCNCSGKLSRVGQSLEPLAQNADALNVLLDLKTNELSFVTAGNELMFYNFLRAKPQLLTRGGLTPQTAFLVRSSIGYGFIGTQSGLEAIEIDARDKPNRYQLLNGKQVWQIAITDNQKTIIALQDGALVSVDIRN